MRLGKVGAACLAMVALVMLAVSLWMGSSDLPNDAGASDTPPNASIWGVAFAWLALAGALAVAAGLAGASLARARVASALRDARLERQALLALLDVWQWHTDDEHRLIRLLPPQGAPATAWAHAGGPLRPIWDRFETEASNEGTLRERLQAQVPIWDHPTVRQLVPGAPSTPWLLRGTPRFDSTGRFVGYLGTARPVEQSHHTRLMQSLISAMPGPAIICAISADRTGRLEHINDAARALIGSDVAPPWEEMLDRFPKALSDALRKAQEHGIPPGGDRIQASGWVAHSRQIDGRVGDEALSVFALAPTAGAAPLDPGIADHEVFSYTVSHDLRAPIRVVEGFARIVKEDYGRLLDKIGIDHLDRVLGAAARMNAMIDALLNLSQLSAQPLSNQPVNLSQMAGYVVDDLRRSTPERVVDVHIERGMLARGDPTLLRVALENLLGNAWKYTAKVSQPQIWMQRTEHGGRPAYAVRDNGAGFDMRFADRLFGAFQRLHSASDFEGTGLGLASVRRIIRRHGGDIWAESEVNCGASFYFTLQRE